MIQEKSKEKKQNRIKSLKNIILLTLAISQMLLVSCKQTSQEPITKTAFALDTVVSITVYDSDDEAILDGALDVIDKYENIYSKTLNTSELYKLNKGDLPSTNNDIVTYEISDELSDIIDYGLEYSEISSGAFDITIEPLSSLWDFKSESPRVPDNKIITEAMSKVGYENVVLDGNNITFKNEDIKIELGAIAKGYIADRVKEYLISQDVESAIIDLGGNILCVGEKPHGQAFKIGIQKPFADRNEIIATMDIKDMSIVTSGVYERYFMNEDKLYHHILNPKTGFPYENDLISVTIVSQESVVGDGLSTTCFALGLEDKLKIPILPVQYHIYI